MTSRTSIDCAPQPQTRRSSFIEAVSNVLVGYVLALLVQRAVFPLFAIHTTLADYSLIAGLFALASLARSYLLRRLFSHLDDQRRRERLEREHSLERRLSTGRL